MDLFYSKHKTYDNIVLFDNKGTFLVHNARGCFNNCNLSLKTNKMNNEEKKCVIECFGKRIFIEKTLDS